MAADPTALPGEANALEAPAPGPFVQPPPRATHLLPPLAAGDVVEGYRLVRHLHQGGMAQLWEVRPDVAEPDATGAEPPSLIMKVPRIMGGHNPAHLVGFEVAQMVLPRLAGPHVPAYVAQGGLSARPYLVMERIPGESLKVQLEQAPLPLSQVTEIGVLVANALHALHRQHVVHLDVKPSHIMFRPAPHGGTPEAPVPPLASEAPPTPGHVAVLVDFGLAHHEHLPDLLDEEFTLPIGTGPYLSPEQVQFVRNDPRSDLFALGVILYHLTTGERPFGAPDSVRGLRERLYRDPTPPITLRPDCPPWLQEVILQALEPSPAQRQQTAAQLAFQLQHPDMVTLTERATRRERRGALARLRRWWGALGAEPGPQASPTQQLARHPLVMVAVDVAQGERALLDALRLTVERLLQTEPHARIACVAVLKTAGIDLNEQTEADGSSRHVNLRVQLRHWARPLAETLKIPHDSVAHRITCQVLESPDAASALLDYARRNHVDHIVMGAHGSGALRRPLGSVSTQVAAQADCSVTVVRAPQPDH